MLGSAAIVAAWQAAFRKHNICAGQILVTHSDIGDPRSRLNDVIHRAVKSEVVPIINENDVLSDIELAKITYGGDNDGLASRIAVNIGASALLLLTNVNGLLDDRGEVVSKITPENYEAACSMANGKSDSGRGGMASKIEAAAQAADNGIDAFIGNALADYMDLLNKQAGTHFTGQ
jgi:glutamate 5-kinase